MYNKRQLQDRLKYNVSMHYIVAVLHNVLILGIWLTLGMITYQCASGGKELQASSSVQFFTCKTSWIVKPPGSIWVYNYNFVFYHLILGTKWCIYSFKQFLLYRVVIECNVGFKLHWLLVVLVAKLSFYFSCTCCCHTWCNDSVSQFPPPLSQHGLYCFPFLISPFFTPCLCGDKKQAVPPLWLDDVWSY